MATSETAIRFHDGSLLEQQPQQQEGGGARRSLTPPPPISMSRRSQPDSDDDEGRLARPPRRSHSKEEWERSIALAEKLEAQELERRRQEQLEQEQLDIELAKKLMEEEEKSDGTSERFVQEQLDCELARLLVDEDENDVTRELQEQMDRELAKQLVHESQQQQQQQTAESLLDMSLLHRMEDESRARRLRAGPIPLEQLLEPCQQRAVYYVRDKAEEMHKHALPFLMDRIMDLGFQPADLQTCLQYIRDDAPIIIHLTEETLTKLTRDTHYRNLFEVHTSGGCRDKQKRATWETTMFGNCYDDNCPPFERPKYGCLNITGDIAGVRSARRYGNCYLVLHEHVRQRASFFDRDSGGFVAQRTLATNEHYAHILNEYSDTDLQAAMNVACNARVGGARSWCSVYKEVQIHGPISLALDIQALAVPGREADATPEFRQAVLEFQNQTNCNVLWQLDLLDPEFLGA